MFDPTRSALPCPFGGGSRRRDAAGKAVFRRPTIHAGAAHEPARGVPDEWH
jgi:hypothetical protein